MSPPRFNIVHWVPKLLISFFCAHAALHVPDTAGVLREPLERGDRKAAVFIFVATDCPISNSYSPEINRIMKDDADKPLDFYLVYSDPALSTDDIKKHVTAFGYTCPALVDHDQLLMHKLKVTLTPEAAVIDANGQMVYQGRIDNWYADFGKQRYAPTTHDLRDALDAIATGKPVKSAVTKAIGCPI